MSHGFWLADIKASCGCNTLWGCGSWQGQIRSDMVLMTMAGRLWDVARWGNLAALRLYDEDDSSCAWVRLVISHKNWQVCSNVNRSWHGNHNRLVDLSNDVTLYISNHSLLLDYQSEPHAHYDVIRTMTSLALWRHPYYGVQRVTPSLASWRHPRYDVIRNIASYPLWRHYVIGIMTSPALWWAQAGWSMT